MSSEVLRRIAGDISRQESITRSLHVARKRQQMMLPRDLPRPNGYSLGTLYRPAEDISGDFYDVIEFDDGQIGLIMGDVTGHGIEAALVMGMAKKTIQIYARALVDPAETLRQANKDLCPDLTDDAFISAIYVLLDPQQHVMKVARAGHTHPLLSNLRRQPTVQQVKCNGMVMGIDDEGHAFDNSIDTYTTQLQRGDTVLLYTDGVDECRGNAEQEFGIDRLMNVLEASASADSPGVCKEIEQRVLLHAQRDTLEDDLTLLAFKRV
jgi:sigma-B regulation protein RsbU (phosphoserine phosphatase)